LAVSVEFTCWLAGSSGAGFAEQAGHFNLFMTCKRLLLRGPVAGSTAAASRRGAGDRFTADMPLTGGRLPPGGPTVGSLDAASRRGAGGRFTADTPLTGGRLPPGGPNVGSIDAASRRGAGGLLVGSTPLMANWPLSPGRRPGASI